MLKLATGPTLNLNIPVQREKKTDQRLLSQGAYRFLRSSVLCVKFEHVILT